MACSAPRQQVDEPIPPPDRETPTRPFSTVIVSPHIDPAEACVNGMPVYCTLELSQRLRVHALYGRTSAIGSGWIARALPQLHPGAWRGRAPPLSRHQDQDGSDSRAGCKK